ncbi:MAG TPA: hypothetical protein VF669_03085 [Tepidisphaeraceae bacterium]|jgi:uncharacterized delta-60 repeat protein
MRRSQFIEQLENRRLFAAGELDLSFGGGDGISKLSTATASQIDRADFVAVDSQGRIVLVGTTRANRNAGTAADILIARFDAAGNLDTTFGGGTGFVTRSFLNVDTPADLAIQPDNKIVIAFRNGSTNPGWGVMRLTTTGANDNTFDGDGVATYDFGTETIVRMALQPDGKIVTVGSATNGGTFNNAAVVRLTSTGALDSTFGSGGIATTQFFSSAALNEFYDVAVDPNNNIVAVGATRQTSTSVTEVGVARFTSTGTLDGTFGTGGKVQIGNAPSHHMAHSVAVDASSRVVVAAINWTDYPNLMAPHPLVLHRLTSGGQVDASFDASGPTPGHVQLNDVTLYHTDPAEMMIQADQKILFGGAYSTTGSNAFQMARLNPDGTRDTSFAGDGTATYLPAGSSPQVGTDFALDSSGRIVMSGLVVNVAALNDYDMAVVRVQNTVDTPVSLAGSRLTIDGTGGVDNVNISRNGSNVVTTINGVSYTFPASQIAVIGAYLEAGADNLTISETTPVRLAVTRTLGSLNLGAGARLTVPVGDGSSPMRIDSLSMSGSSALDLTNNDLIVTSGDYEMISNLRWQGYRDFRDTTATGIISSTGQTTTGSPILALFDNTLLHATDWPWGSGNTVPAGAVVGRYTYIGDADLNGMVTPDDYGAIDANLGQKVSSAGGMNWFAGDWNFDGQITPDDYGAVDANLGNGEGNPLAPARAAGPAPLALSKDDEERADLFA